MGNFGEKKQTRCMTENARRINQGRRGGWTGGKRTEGRRHSLYGSNQNVCIRFPSHAERSAF